MKKAIRHIVIWAAIAGGGLAFPTLGRAELEKVLYRCDAATCYHWMPKLSPVAGFHQDRERLTEFGMNVLVPDGYTYQSAEYIIYARALHKPLVSETPSLDRFIQQEKKDYLALNPRRTMTEVPAVTTGGGKKLRSFTLKPENQGVWEQITYSDEGEYFVIIVVSSQTENGYKKALPIYKRILASYR